MVDVNLTLLEVAELSQSSCINLYSHQEYMSFSGSTSLTTVDIISLLVLVILADV